MFNELRTCLLCGSTNLQYEFSAKCNADGAIKDYQILRCHNCTVALTDPMPKIADKFYNSGIYAKNGGRASVFADLAFAWLYNTRLREIQRFSSEKGRLLDVGCGKGRFVASACRHGWQAEGTDVIQGQVRSARERYDVKISFGEIWELGFDANSFDVVTAWHVLEHLPQPHKVVGEISRIMRTNGLFVCEVPYQASWQATIGKGLWFQLDVPRHLLHYNLSALQYLLHKHNLEIQHISTFSPELGYFGMLQTMMNRVVSSPNWLFRWLKRTHGTSKPSILAKQLIVGSAVALPAISAETIAIILRRGGVLRVVAKKQ